jgi:hypothetical protein
MKTFLTIYTQNHSSLFSGAIANIPLAISAFISMFKKALGKTPRQYFHYNITPKV